MTVGVIGSGAWGTALGLRIAENGNDVLLWGRNAAVIQQINEFHENRAYLPGAVIPEKVAAVDKLGDLREAEAIFLAAPSQYLRGICLELKRYAKSQPLVICSKGIEEKSLALMSEMVREIFPKNPLAILSGPNFASEIAMGLPAAATLACEDSKVGESLTKIISSNIFRIYHSSDLIGAEIGGAVKNVMAIACGIALGKGYGENARAALITRGLAETVRLAVKLGGRQETLMGLSGIGDLVLTCSSLKSRNMSLGYDLGQGRSLPEILAERGNRITEGVASSRSVVKLAEKIGVEMPISNAVHAILHQGAGIYETINNLLSRKSGGEYN